MDWREIEIITTPQLCDVVCDVLYEFDIDGINIEDYRDVEEFIATKDYWIIVEDDLRPQHQDVIIKTYFKADESFSLHLQQLQSRLETLKSYNPHALLQLKTERWIEEKDWSEEWKKHFKPIEVGERFMIKPSWERIGQTDRLVIDLDPGMAFGTGTHETTALCLEAMEHMDLKDRSVLDVGTGSGILAVGAALLGAGCVTGIDIDPLSVDAAKENIEKNGVSHCITVYQGDLTQDVKEKYDVILANILAPVVVSLSEDLHRILNDGGWIITSGILNTQRQMVVEALEKQGLHVENVLQRKDWIAMIARK